MPKIRTTNGLFTVTPGGLYFRSDKDYILVAEYPGYELQQQELKPKQLVQPSPDTLLGRMIRGNVYLAPKSQGSTLLSRVVHSDLNPPPKPHVVLTPRKVHFKFSKSRQGDANL